MTRILTRRTFAKAAASAAALAALTPRMPAFAAADGKTLRFIAQSDLRVLDPIWTTAYVTRNHGYMVFDTLFALDDKFAAHPQMVRDYSVSEDRLLYRFALRDGLKFHDGEPVRGSDCTASLTRWMVRDGLGQTLATVIEEMRPEGDSGFSIRVKTPFPMLIDGLAKVSSLAPFIMPERLARTDPYQQVTEMIGSGPFKFVRDEFEPGHRAVYVKNAEYVPRSEPVSWASGGKIVKVNRVEWLYLPDAMTKVAALNGGEVDWWENPPLDLLPVLSSNPEVTVQKAGPLGDLTMIRFNHLYPPFDNVKMRQAVLAAADQADYMTTLAGDPKYWRVCASTFTCGTPMSSDAGSVAQTGKRDFDKAKKLIAEAGYKGEKIIVLDAVDQPNPHVHALVTADLLKKLGLNVEVAAMDWGSLVTRRASKEPPDKGGWNIFGTGWVGADMLDPALNVALRANGEKAWFGWPTDDQLETLRAQWIAAETLEERKKLAAAIQQRAYEFVPYIPTGQWTPMTAFRKNVKGVAPAPAFFMWNVEKA